MKGGSNFSWRTMVGVGVNPFWRSAAGMGQHRTAGVEGGAALLCGHLE